jgi:hypothetical protein
MRKYFNTKGSILQLIDFGDSPIFENATTYTNILVWKKGKEKTKSKAWDLSKTYANDTTLDKLLEKEGECDALFSEDSFVVVKGDQSAIKRRIEEVGVPLKDWDISINYGIKTGLNEAFIIDGKKKDELIAKDLKSAEILKPILRVRDIKRYKAEFADLWLIASHNGYTDRNSDRVTAVVVKKNYPAIWEYLINANKETNGQGEKRCDQGNHWTNLRDCAYFAEFEKEKIFIPAMVDSASYLYDDKGYLGNDKTSIITGNGLKYLCALMNSKLLWNYIKQISSTKAGGFFEIKPMYVNQLPIPKIPITQQLPFEILVDCILFCKSRNNAEMDSSSTLLESVIDGLVYDLYFPSEMKAAHCYITDRISSVLKPFKKNDTIAFKTEYITELCKFFRKNEIIYHGLIHRKQKSYNQNGTVSYEFFCSLYSH